MVVVIRINPLYAQEALGVNMLRLPLDKRLSVKGHTPVRTSIIQLAIAHTFPTTENSLLFLSRLYDFFHILIRDELQDLDVDLPDTLSPKQKSSILKLKLYIYENYSQKITLNTAADALSFTPQYLSGLIRNCLDTTFLSLLNAERLRHARTYILFSSLSDEKIIALCGFTDKAQFSALMKEKYGSGSSEIREFSENMHSAYSLSRFRFRQSAMVRDYIFNDLPGQEFSHMPIIEKTNKITGEYDVTNTTPLFSAWDSFINLGNAPTLESSTFLSHMGTIQNVLNFRYGRITQILDLADIYTGDHGEISYSFTRIFSLVDNLLSAGIRPFFNLADSMWKTIAPGDDPRKFDYLAETMIPQLLGEFINRYGFEEVNLWIFEIWQRNYGVPDGPLETPANYARRFSFIYEKVKSSLPKVLIGGPGFDTTLSFSYLDETLKELAKRNVTPDFISCSLSLRSRDPEYHISPVSDEFNKRLAQVKWLAVRNGMKNIPIFVTELSTSIDFRNHINDSMYLAVFLFRNMLSCRKQSQQIGYWLASDTVLEHSVKSEFLFGGSGLLSRLGLRKPGFFAYAWLKNLGTKLIGEGENYILTSGEGEYKLCFYHYTHFSEEYCKDPGYFDSELYLDGAFRDSDTLDISIRLNNMEKGTWRITMLELSAEYGSLFHEWARMHFVQNFSQYESEVLFDTCCPRMSVDTVSIEDHYDIHLILPRLIVVFFLIRRQV